MPLIKPITKRVPETTETEPASPIQECFVCETEVSPSSPCPHHRFRLDDAPEKQRVPYLQIPEYNEELLYKIPNFSLWKLLVLVLEDKIKETEGRIRTYKNLTKLYICDKNTKKRNTDLEKNIKNASMYLEKAEVNRKKIKSFEILLEKAKKITAEESSDRFESDLYYHFDHVDLYSYFKDHIDNWMGLE